MNLNPRLLVLYGSQTYTAKELAERIWRTTKTLGFSGPVMAMDDYPISALIHEEYAIFVCSTTGQGDEPENMKQFWKFLLRKNLPANSLVKLKYGVLGLGDSSYIKFNFVGKRLHKRLLQLGATALIDIGLCDYQHDLGHDAVMVPWLNKYLTTLKIYFPYINIDNLSSTFVPKWNVSLLREGDPNTVMDTNSLTEDIYFSKGCRDKFVDYFLFEVESNVRTTDEKHFQDVRLIRFNTVTDAVLDYLPGDIFIIRPRNRKEDINELFSIFEEHNIDIKPHYKLLVEKCHNDMPVPPFLKIQRTMYEIAEQYWDLRAYPSQYVFSLLAFISEDKTERDKCLELSSPAGEEDWLNYSRRPRRTILEVLRDFHHSASKLTIPVLFELFSTIKPRSFSIASSALMYQKRKIDILVAVVKYRTKLKKARYGLASNWLKTLNPGDRVYGWLKAGTLMFPMPHIPLIMICTGTGIAPFHSLIQECNATRTLDGVNMHLFYGCRYCHKDFHFKDALEEFSREGKLSLYCAFSREQDAKKYVQHMILEYSQMLHHLIMERYGYVYIIGSSKNMPEGVKESLAEIMKIMNGLEMEHAKNLIQRLERDGRLQVETW
ncbi:hypothetical protein ACJJTC_006783 [Scirpophaga incertulas]